MKHKFVSYALMLAALGAVTLTSLPTAQAGFEIEVRYGHRGHRPAPIPERYPSRCHREREYAFREVPERYDRYERRHDWHRHHDYGYHRGHRYRW